jgi:hypothetical protein
MAYCKGIFDTHGNFKPYRAQVLVMPVRPEKSQRELFCSLAPVLKFGPVGVSARRLERNTGTLPPKQV